MPKTHYKVDSSSVREGERRDRDAERETAERHGFYQYKRFVLVPIGQIAHQSVWNPGRIESILDAIDRGKPLPPIRADRDRGKYDITDGIHRYNASLQRGYTHIPVLETVTVDAPEMYVPPMPEKPVLRPGTYVKLTEKPYRATSLWARVEEYLGPYRGRGDVNRHVYALDGIVNGHVDFVGDWHDDKFNVGRPPRDVLEVFAEEDVAMGKKASSITFTGPHDAIKAGLETSGKDAVYFSAEIPNPDYDPEEYYVIRGVKKWWEKPTKSVAYLTIDLDQKGESYQAGTAWTDDKHRRQGLIRRLYDMAWDYARSKGKGFRSGWVQSPHMARYWESMVSKGQAEPYTDEWTRSNITDKGWRRIKSSSASRVASRYRKATTDKALKSLMQQDFYRYWGAEGHAEKVNGGMFLLGTARTHNFDAFVNEVWGKVYKDSDYDELKAALRPIYSRLSKPKITLDKKQSGSSMWITMYDHGHEIGYISSNEKPSLVRFLQKSRSRCESDLRKLLDQYGDAPIVNIWDTSLLYPFQGQGLGKAMYEAVLDHYRQQGSCYAMPDYCGDGATSEDALRVWKSLARKYPSEGECLWIA